LSTENEKKAQLFSERLQHCRKQLGLSQQELADKIGANLKSVQNWEGGDFTPRGENLRNLAVLFKVDVAYLLGEKKSPNPAEDTHEDEAETAYGFIDYQALLKIFLSAAEQLKHTHGAQSGMLIRSLDMMLRVLRRKNTTGEDKAEDRALDEEIDQQTNDSKNLAKKIKSGSSHPAKPGQ
jgi:transcriptional regulator with XRE-family HTH domain